ncbi:MAG TPA: hypothetical protein VF171_02720, partial [Trueperaceae bacterium]
GLWQDSLYGFRYIFAIRSLLGLQLVFFVANLVAVLGFTVLSPMILARSGNNEVILGTVRAASGIGGLLGGLLLSFWGGPKRKIHGILTGVVLVSIFGQVLMGVGRDVVLWSCASFVIGALPIIINGANQAIWQSKVDPSVQGRVFATRSMIAQITTPLAMLLAGPLADFVFEPAMMPGGALAPVFGPVVGTGTGAGMALMLVLSGALAAVVGVAGYAVGFVRDVEDLIPDHDAETAVPVTASP